MTVSPLVSEMDARSLHEHFVHVELEKIDGEIGRLSVELDEFSYDVEEGPSWPVGLPPTERPPNRYQVESSRKNTPLAYPCLGASLGVLHGDGDLQERT